MSVQGKDSLTGVLLAENAIRPTGDIEKKDDQVDFGAALAAMLTATAPQSVALAPKEASALPKTSDSALLAIDGKSLASVAASPPALVRDDSHRAQFGPPVPAADLKSQRGKNQPLATTYRESPKTGWQPGWDNSWTDPFVLSAPVAAKPAGALASKEAFAQPKTFDSALLTIDGKSPAYIAASSPELAGDDSQSAQIFRSMPVAAEATVEIAAAGSARLAGPSGSANPAPAPPQADKNPSFADSPLRHIAHATAGDSALSMASSPAAAPSAEPKAITARSAYITTPSEGSNPSLRSSGHPTPAQPGPSPPSPKDGSDPPRDTQVASGDRSNQPETDASQQVSANSLLLPPQELDAADRERAPVHRDSRASVDRGAAVNSPRGEEPQASPVQISAPISPPREAGQSSEATRTATLKVELGDGKSAQATVRERSGSVEVRIVAPNRLAEQKISAEIGGLRYALDNAGLRLARAEVSYQTDGRGGREGADSGRDAHRQQAKKNEIFTLNEVNK